MRHLRDLWHRTRSIHASLLLVTVFTAGFLLGSQYNITSALQIQLTAEEEEEFEALYEAYGLLREQYLDPLDTHQVVEGAISGMLDAVGDQYTGYMSSDVYTLLNEDISGEIQGIGVVIRTIEETGEIEIANIMPGTPADRSGVEVGDIFLTVDGEDVTGYNQLELAGIVRGPRGTEVEITFRRGDDTVTYTIERDRIILPTTEHTRLEGDIGYIRLFEFNSQSRPQIDDAIEDLQSGGALNGLILDLRGNPGGTLDSSIDVTSAFIEDGVVLREQFNRGREEVLRTNGSFNDIGVPLVLLVDETSASASELVSGALQDAGVATIMGETTFGKGTVQVWQGLSNGGGVRITIARWLTPNGNWINEQGITPDIIVEWDPEGGYFLNLNDAESIAGDVQLQAAADYLRGLDITTAADTADLPLDEENQPLTE